MASALLSTLHLLALALGLPSVFFRGRALLALSQGRGEITRVFAADNVWGVSALLWLATGLTRAFGGFEKGSGFYLANQMFLLKLGLFGLIVLLELWPMVTLIRWRIRTSKGQVIDTSSSRALFRINTIELGFTLLIPFIASMMARGIGFTGLS
jgi:putative membrane protein